MFVQGNSLKDIKEYYQSKLQNYSRSEIKLIVKSIAFKRLKINDIDYILSADILLSESDLLYFHDCLKKLNEGVPLQYLLGEVEFCGLSLCIDERALIPRPETEELVDWVASAVKNNESISILDLCSGSGCIALSLKSKISSAKIEAAEYSTSAIELLKNNIQKTALDVKVVEMNVLLSDDYAKLRESTYDIWISNPPYIPESEKSLMSENVLNYEPGMALFVSDEHPLLFYREIVNNSLKFLKNGGWIYFEINENYAEEVGSVLAEMNFVNIELRKDLQGKPRMMRAQRLFSSHES